MARMKTIPHCISLSTGLRVHNCAPLISIIELPCVSSVSLSLLHSGSSSHSVLSQTGSMCPLHPDWGPGGKALWAWVPWDRMYELPSRLPGCTHTSTWDDTGGAVECVCVCMCAVCITSHAFWSFVHDNSSVEFHIVYLPILDSLTHGKRTNVTIPLWNVF